MGREGQVLPPTKRLGRNRFSHTEGGGGAKGFGVVLTWEFEVLAILTRGTKHFHPLKGAVGAQKV